MKFGSVEDPEHIDFTLPQDHSDTVAVLAQGAGVLQEVFVGCAKWSRKDLKGFYPRGTKDELAYYASQFNAIELNATFYNSYQPERIAVWRDKAPDGFRFFPKVHRYISHIKRLKDVELSLEKYLHSILAFEDKLGMSFLQLHNNFAPKNMDRLATFLDYWPLDMPLAIELRHADWFDDESVAANLYGLLETHQVANIIVDTAGRRDLMHMRLTTPVAFVRFVGANHPSDYDRLSDWIIRIKEWKAQGLEKLYFFIHQNMETASPLLGRQFIKELNETFNVKLNVPVQQVIKNT